MMIDQERAIELARQEASAREFRLASVDPFAIRKEKHMSLDRHSPGWLIVLPLDVPEGLETDRVMIEVYDDGRVFTPTHL